MSSGVPGPTSAEQAEDRAGRRRAEMFQPRPPGGARELLAGVGLPRAQNGQGGVLSQRCLNKHRQQVCPGSFLPPRLL